MILCFPSYFFSGHGFLRFRVLCWGLMMTFALTGCAGPGKSSRAQPALSEKKLLKQWRHVSKEPPAVPSAGGVLTVDDVISEALRASPELEQIRQRIAAAGEQIRQADASFYPRLVASERFNSTNNPVYALMNIINQRRLKADVNFNDPGSQQDFATRIRADWTLFEGGSRYYHRQAAAGFKESLEAELMAARNRMVAKVVETYYHWLQTMGFIGVAEKAYASADMDVQLAEARFKAEMALPQRSDAAEGAPGRNARKSGDGRNRGADGCRPPWNGSWPDPSTKGKFPTPPFIRRTLHPKSVRGNPMPSWPRPFRHAPNWPRFVR